MNKLIFKYALYIIGGYVLLSLFNFIIRNSVKFQNLLILLVIIISLYFGKKYIKQVFIQLDKLPPHFLFLLIAIPAVISLLIFSPSYWDDVLTLHEQALSDISDGTVKYGYPYSIRNLFYILPIYNFLGEDLWIIKVVNLIIYLLTAFLFFRILWNLFPNKKAYSYIGVLLFFSIPYFALSVSIPHYDLPGTFYLILSLAILQLLLKIINSNNSNNSISFVYSLLFGLSFIPLFYTRGLFIVIGLTSLIFLFFLFISDSLKTYGKVKVLFFVFMIPFSLYMMFNSTIKKMNFTDTSEELWTSEQKVFSYNDTRFDGTSEHQDKKWMYFPQIDIDLRKQYAMLKLNSEIYYNWHWYLYRLSTKNAEVFRIGGLNKFVIHDFLYEEELGGMFEFWEVILQYIIALFAIIGLVYFLSNSRSNDLFRLFSLIFLFVCSFFILFTEARSRYSLIFIFTLIIFALDGLRYYMNKDFFRINFIKKGVYYVLIFLFSFGSMFFMYRQIVAKKYRFVQIAPSDWRKDIGKINLTAFQKEVTDSDSKINLGKVPKNIKSVTYFVRSYKENIDNLKMTFSSGNHSDTLKILPNDFEVLYHSPELAVNFYRIRLDNKVVKDDLYLDFNGSDFNKNFVVEFVSFNNE